MLKDDIEKLAKEVEEGQELIRAITREVRIKRRKLNKLRERLELVLRENAQVGK